MTKKQKAKEITTLLDINYPLETKCYLDHSAPHELLIATILSAQCTDDRVNIVTKDLFEKYPSIAAFADAELAEMEEAVKSTGFYRNKAKNIILSMRKLRDGYCGVMPSAIDELTGFAGVGRKTANVIRGHIFNIPSIVVDTHVLRISNKLGLSESQDPVKTEFELMKVLEKDSWIKYNTQVIAHGRKICTARSPKCDICFLSGFCVWNKKK